MVNITVAVLLNCQGTACKTRFYSQGTCLGWPHLAAATGLSPRQILLVAVVILLLLPSGTLYPR